MNGRFILEDHDGDPIEVSSLGANDGISITFIDSENATATQLRNLDLETTRSLIKAIEYMAGIDRHPCFC